MSSAVSLHEIKLRRALLAQRAMHEREKLGAAFGAVTKHLAPADLALAVVRRLRESPWSGLLAAVLTRMAVRRVTRSGGVKTWLLVTLGTWLFKQLRRARGKSPGAQPM